MSIKAVKEHFSEHFSSNSISKHWNNHLHAIIDIKVLESDKNDKDFGMRKFKIEDTAKCAELFKEVFSDYPWYDYWVSVDQARNYLMELIKNPVFEGFIAYEGSAVVAVCFGHKRSWWRGKEFFIDEFYVANEMQGNGIGTELLNYVKESLIKLGYRQMVLLTNKEIPAEEFYIKNGFYNNQNRTVMSKEL